MPKIINTKVWVETADVFNNFVLQVPFAFHFIRVVLVDLIAMKTKLLLQPVNVFFVC